MGTETKPSTAFKTWTKRFDEGHAVPIRKSLIGKFGAVYNVIYARDWQTQKSTLTKDEANILADLLHGSPGFPLTDDHTSMGLAWLEKNRRMVEKEGMPIDRILENFSHFTWQDWETDYHVPIYRIHLKDGSAFDYWFRSWQSGGGFGWWRAWRA